MAAVAEAVDVTAPQTRMLEQRRQVVEVEEALIARKREFLEQTMALRVREEALRRKDLDLQDALLRINPLLEEFASQKVRAEKRAAEEELATAAKAREVREVRAALAETRLDANALTHERERLLRRSVYLQHFVAANSEEFPDVASVLDRYATLSTAHADLLSESSRLGAQVDASRRALARVQKARSTTAMTAENTLARLKERLENARSEVSRLAVGAEEGAQAAAARALELGQMLRSVANLHGRCVRGPYGSVIHHVPSDADAQGRGVSTAFADTLARFVGAGSRSRSSSAGGSESTGGDSSGGMGGDDRGGAGRGADGDDRGGDGQRGASPVDGVNRATVGRAPPPVFLAYADTSFYHVGGHAQGEGGAVNDEAVAAAAAASAAAEASATGLEPAAVVEKVRAALAALEVVGSFITDLNTVAEGYPEHIAAKAAAEKDAATAAAAEVAHAAAEKVEAAKRAASSRPSMARQSAQSPRTSSMGGSRPPISPIASTMAMSRPPSSLSLKHTSSNSSILPPRPGASAVTGIRSVGTSTAMGASMRTGAGAPAPGALNAAVVAAAAAASAAGGTPISAEAQRVASSLARAGVRTYFAAQSPLPPPPEAVAAAAAAAAAANVRRGRVPISASGRSPTRGMTPSTAASGGMAMSSLAVSAHLRASRASSDAIY